MDSRSTRYRSLDAKTTAPPSRTRERHNSAPTVDRAKEQQSRHASAASTPVADAHRSARSSPRDPLLNSPDRKVPDRRAPHRKSADRSSGRPTLSASASTSDLSKPADTLTLTSPSSFKFVVLGARHAGKTAFIQNAVDRERNSTSTKVVVKDRAYRLRFIELSLDDVDYSLTRPIEWPAYVNGAPFPRVDGVFCLYDPAHKESLADMPAALTSITNAGLGCMLIAPDTNANRAARPTSAKFHDLVRRNLPSVGIAEVSIHSAEGPRTCVLSMVDRLTATARESTSSPSTPVVTKPRQPDNATQSDAAVARSRSRSRSHSNSRLRISKSKELLLNLPVRTPVLESPDEEAELVPPEQKTKLRLDTSGTSNHPRRPADPQTPVSSGEAARGDSLFETGGVAVPETPDSFYMKSTLRPASLDTVDSRAYQTFLNMDEDTNDHASGLNAESAAAAMAAISSTCLKPEDRRPEPGVPFKELVGRLLGVPATKTDSKFVPAFLCLYRAFATPRHLLVAMIDQFMNVEKSKKAHLSKVEELLRYLGILAQWTATYPGDFSAGSVRDLAIPFVQSIEKSKVFAPVAREISNNLDFIIADEDADWAYDDGPAVSGGTSEKSAQKKTPTSSSLSLPSLSMDAFTKGGRKYDRDSDDSDEEGEGTNSSAPASNTPSAASSMIKAYSSSSQSCTNFVHLEKAKLQAQKYRSIPRLRLTKLHWHQFMDTPVEEMAKEITRIDWTVFTAIRPRDFVRHVCLSSERKRRSDVVDNISAMVKHFNHLALFVSGMILLRDKPKHRAKALERFMALAWKVRQMNNYNSLGAIVAGITGHEIARLTATMELIPPDVQKQFLRLTILMGISRSHAAYRMAWENSFNERIPFLPLVRQDLTMAASANQTFIGTNINWRKFEIMGEVIVGIQRSLENSYSFGQPSLRSEEIAKLLLETKVVDDSEDSADPRGELYDRSVQVEPQNGVDPKKKFDWLRR